MSGRPFICRCGASAAEPPGFRVLPLPEAVGVNDELIAVTSFECLSCGARHVVPLGSVEVRRP